MSLIKVPIFSKLNERNGTLYNFQNFNNDLTQSFANGATFKRVPSKFVCVKIPRWNNITGRHIYLAPDKISTTPLVTNPNILFPKLLQNYMENLNAYAIQEDIKDSNVPEMAFWKLMNTLGAVKFDTRTDGSIFDSIDDSDEFVKYIGDINLVNYVEYGNRTYTEQYIHVKHDAKKITSLNWKNGATSQKTTNLARLPQLENGQDISLGLTDDPTELTHAVYDFDTNGDTKQYYDFSLKSNKAIIDFPSMVNGTENDDFDFNAILLYYDTYELDAKGNEIGRRTKLGSVFVIDDFVQNAGGGYWEIPSVTKYNSDENNVLAGNAIAYRLCTNFFSSNEQSTVDTIVNQFNTVSMDLYVKALSEMMKTGDLFSKENSLITEIADRLGKLNYGEDLYEKLRVNEERLAELTQTVNSVIGASGYTVTNFELLDAFQKLSNDFKGLNGQNVENVFVFNGNIDNNEIKFNRLYTYVAGGKYSIGYSDESMLQIGLVRNRLLSKYAVQHKAVGNYLNLKLTSASDPIVYSVDGQIYTNAVNGQEIQVAFSPSEYQAIPYVLVINKTNGKFEIYDYEYMKKTALENFAYVGSFILTSLDSYNDIGLPTLEDSESLGKLDNDIHVQLRDGETQGTYETGDIIPSGTTLREVVKKMLVDTKNLTYEQPSTDVIFEPYILPSANVLTPLKYSFTKNDAGLVTQSTITSNSFDISIKVNFPAGLITIGNDEYSVTDSTDYGLLQNELFTVFQNDDKNRFELRTKSHKFISTNIGTILQELNADGEPDDFYNKSISVPLTTTTVQTFVLTVQIESFLSSFSDSGNKVLLIPMKYSQTVTNLIVQTVIEYNAGNKKYDIFGDEVAGFITAGSRTQQFQFGRMNPIILASLDTVGSDIPNMNVINHLYMTEFKKIFRLGNVEVNDSEYIAFCVPETVDNGNDNSYTLLSLFMDDGLRFNLLACERESQSIAIEGIDYIVDYYKMPAGFIGTDNGVKGTMSRYDDYSTFDLSFEPTFK